MAERKQGNPLAVRFSEADLAALNKAAALTGRSRNSLVVEGARLLVGLALSAANKVSADNAAPEPVLTDSNDSAGGRRGRRNRPEGRGQADSGELGKLGAPSSPRA